jgi:hypothetical protein
MEEIVLEANEEFNKIIEFVTRDPHTWEFHSVKRRSLFLLRHDV